MSQILAFKNKIFVSLQNMAAMEFPNSDTEIQLASIVSSGVVCVSFILDGIGTTTRYFKFGEILAMHDLESYTRSIATEIIDHLKRRLKNAQNT